MPDAEKAAPSGTGPERYTPDPAAGLDARQVAAREAEGLRNADVAVSTKSVGAIVRDNLCTLFNLVNAVLAAAIFLVGSYKNLLFLGVVVCNLAIGIFQEIRAKRVIDRLSLTAAAKAQAVRGGAVVELPPEELVLDDVLALRAGSQIGADCILLTGGCEVNESFVTGEADAVYKKPGDLLLAGSFVVSGAGRAQVEHVGAQNYISSISRGAKRLRTVKSEILSALRRIIFFVSVLIFPVGGVLFYRQLTLDKLTLQDAVVKTAAALIGMIPEGLFLLTSTVLAVGVVRLSRRRVLVQELYCIETLARVDTLCLDKTGTLTKGNLRVAGLYPLADVPPADVEAALRALVRALPDRNATFQALADEYGCESDWEARQRVPFSSRAKWSGAWFGERGCYAAGAAEFLFPDLPRELRARLDAYARQGRVLLLARADGPFPRPDPEGPFLLPEGLVPVAAVVLQDEIRPQAARTLRYFAEEGVAVKVISGDSVVTVSQIARAAGVPDWERAVDTSTLATEEELRRAASEYAVFGRVLPEQKRLLVRAMREAGHTVAMTGDGVNDVLALQEADCSIAMASGSDAARNVSQLVLLDSSFDGLPRVVREGRRSINNIQRSASLFLVKTIYSALLALIFLFLPLPYPFMPIQLTLISALTIGAPAFFLALEPNNERVRGHFLKNVLLRAVPGGLTTVLCVIATLTVSAIFRISSAETSTMCVLLAGFTGFLLLLRLCRPFTRARAALFSVLAAAFCGCAVFLQPLFSLTPLSLTAAVCLAATVVGAYFVFDGITALTGRFLNRKGEEKSERAPRSPRFKSR